MMKEIMVCGASGFAAEITEYVQDNNDYLIKGYFDLNDSDYSKYNFSSPYLGSEDDFKFTSNDSVVLAIASVNLRKKIYEKLKEKKINFQNFIHKSCFISKGSYIDEGAVLCPFVTLTSNVKVGKNFHANIYSYIAHDCIIGNNVTFAPAVKCNGNVIIEDNVYVGTGAIIFQGKENRPLVIGAGVTIAAGSVVTKSIPAGKTVFGNPAIEFTKENIKRRG